MKKITPKHMTVLAGVGFAAVFLYLAVKLTMVMVYDAGPIREMAASQLKQESILPAQRGDIVDRSGSLLASSVASFRVEADLLSMQRSALGKTVPAALSAQEEEQILAYAREVSLTLDPFLAMDQEGIYRILTAKNSQGRFLSYGLLGKKEEIAQLDSFRTLCRENSLSWLIVSDDTKRYYPNSAMLAQTLGILDAEDKGRFGLEAYYEDYLAGIDGLKISEVDKLSQDILLTEPVITPPVDGSRLVTTIDEKIQRIAEEAARTGFEQNKAKGVHVIVTDPRTGEILALAKSPGFDLNEPFAVQEGEEVMQKWKNNPIADTFEPGSTFKIVTMAAALSEGVVDENDVFDCKGYVIVDGIRINCAKKDGHGRQDYFDILANSCNPAFIELGKRVGTEKLKEWTKRFGLGTRTGIDLGGEAPGVMEFKAKTSSYSLANKSIGQATLVTSLQLLNDLNTVINQGRRTTPHLLKEIRQKGTDGAWRTVVSYQELKTEDILDDKAALTLLEMLENSVENGGSKAARIEGVRVLGKTGTAQKVNPATGKYEFYVSSFVGAAPAEDPRISVFVAVDEPGTDRTLGGQVAAPLARQIMEQALTYLDSPQTEKAD